MIAMDQSLLWICIFCVCLGIVQSQGVETPTVDTSSTGLVYFLLVLIFTMNLGIPIIKWIYLNYIKDLVHKAAVEIGKVTSRISDRLSDAGRRVSETMRK